MEKTLNEYDKNRTSTCIKYVCDNCGAILHPVTFEQIAKVGKGWLRDKIKTPISIPEVIASFNGKCPNCQHELKFKPEKIEVNPR
jgi:hypothetical protein